jgi:hypothetical protein
MTTDQLTRRVRSRRVKIEAAKTRLADLFEEQHRDYLAMFEAGVPKLRIAREGGTDKQQVRKAIDNLLAKEAGD